MSHRFVFAFAFTFACASASILGLAACQIDPDLTTEEPTDEPGEVAAPGVPADLLQSAKAVAKPADPDVLRCDADGEFGIKVVASGLEGLEGASVWLSAVQPVDGGDDEVVVLLAGRVEGGAFRLACDRGLTTNYAYPSLAAVVDRDGSGACSSADDVFRMQLYGWNQAEEYGLVGDEVMTPFPIDNAWNPVAEVPPPWGEDLCAYHFPGL